jgi:hypothetical protein
VTIEDDHGMKHVKQCDVLNEAESWKKWGNLFNFSHLSSFVCKTFLHRVAWIKEIMRL